MSKSFGNCIGINESADTMYTKVMQIPDNLIVRYYELATDVHPDEIDKIKVQLEKGEVNPRYIKMSLANEIVALYHNSNEALRAQQNFVTVFQSRACQTICPT